MKSVSLNTKEIIIKSFWDLYKKEDFTKITIGKICKKANYDRTTFYRYFLDINDLLNQVENDIISNIAERIKKAKSVSKNGINPLKFEYFTSIYGEFIVTFMEKGNRTFYNKFKNLIKEDVYNYFNLKFTDESMKDFIFEFMISSFINSYAYWFRHQDKMPLETFVSIINKMMNSDFLKKTS